MCGAGAGIAAAGDGAADASAPLDELIAMASRAATDARGAAQGGGAPAPIPGKTRAAGVVNAAMPPAPPAAFAAEAAPAPAQGGNGGPPATMSTQQAAPAHSRGRPPPSAGRAMSLVPPPLPRACAAGSGGGDGVGRVQRTAAPPQAPPRVSPGAASAAPSDPYAGVSVSATPTAASPAATRAAEEWPGSAADASPALAPPAGLSGPSALADTSSAEGGRRVAAEDALGSVLCTLGVPKAATVDAAPRGGPAPAAACFTLAQLAAPGPFPPGVDVARREEFLGDDAFAAALGVPRDAWSALPAWRRAAKKKAAGLF